MGFGAVGSYQLLVLEQIVVDNEIIHPVERIFQSPDSSLEKILTDDVVKLVPGGVFLTVR